MVKEGIGLFVIGTKKTSDLCFSFFKFEKTKIKRKVLKNKNVRNNRPKKQCRKKIALIPLITAVFLLHYLQWVTQEENGC